MQEHFALFRTPWTNGVQATADMSVCVTAFRSDFETAAFSSMEHLFPKVKVKLCFFHKRQAKWRMVQEHGPNSLHQCEKQFALNIRKLSMLAFTKESNIRQVLAELKDTLPEEAEGLVRYFRKHTLVVTEVQPPTLTSCLLYVLSGGHPCTLFPCGASLKRPAGWAVHYPLLGRMALL